MKECFQDMKLYFQALKKYFQDMKIVLCLTMESFIVECLEFFSYLCRIFEISQNIGMQPSNLCRACWDDTIRYVQKFLRELLRIGCK